MNINKINKSLINEIKKRISGSVIDSLMQILPLSKEAIYRRLRGDVAFPYAEAVLISQKLDISLDEINSNNQGYFVFNIIKPSGISSIEVYDKFLEFGTNHLIDNHQYGISHLCLTTTGIPLSLIANYEYLSRFRFFKWLHENRGLQIQKSKLSEIEISQESLGLLAEFKAILRQINSTLILTDMMFEHYLKEIQYFISMELIEKNDVELIKEDLHKLIYEFEAIVASGKYKDGARISVYLTDINIDPTFGYLEKGKSEFAYSRMFGMNYAVSKNPQVFRMYKDTFEDLKDYATLISQSGSARRTSFLNEQHKLVDRVLIT